MSALLGLSIIKDLYLLPNIYICLSVFVFHPSVSIYQSIIILYIFLCIFFLICLLPIYYLYIYLYRDQLSTHPPPCLGTVENHKPLQSLRKEYQDFLAPLKGPATIQPSREPAVSLASCGHSASSMSVTRGQRAPA